jgi:hypothetical protein
VKGEDKGGCVQLVHFTYLYGIDNETCGSEPNSGILEAYTEMSQ